MVSADDSLQGTKAHPVRQWRRPRLLLALFALGFCISVYAIFLSSGGGGLSEGSGWSLSRWLRDEGLVSIVQDFSDEMAGNGKTDLESKPWHQHRVCSRILQIVESACGYESAERDSEVYWACVAGELKYTMWSAYGCN